MEKFVYYLHPLQYARFVDEYGAAWVEANCELIKPLPTQDDVDA